MQIGFIGIGKMGAGLVSRLRAAGIETWAWNRSGHELANCQTVEEVVGKMKAGKRVIWLMVKAGSAVDEMIDTLIPQLSVGDVVIDGGNSFYKDTLKRTNILNEKGIILIDVGVSGGPRGALEGACLMIGGEKEVVSRLDPVWNALAAPKAFQYLGKAGAGHFAKMVHNGIEYGMMEAIAEGAAILKASQFEYNLADVFRIYNNKSVIESRLVGWAQEALNDDNDLTDTSSQIGQLGEGAWTAEAADELGVDVPVIHDSLKVRNSSMQEPENFRNKVVSALRGKFGGHNVKKGQHVDSFEGQKIDK